MPAPATTDDLLDLIRKSGLIDPVRLEAFLEQAGHDAPPTPKRFLGYLVNAGLITQFHAEQFLLGKWRGFTIGKYKVLERLGFGGTGAVYLCEHLVVKRRVAVKVLPMAKAENPAALGRFYREARAAGVLDHPNLVRAHDIDQDGGLHFLVMDYVDGASLQEVVSKCGPLDLPRAVDYVRQAALGLQHAHESGLVHRDVKPANILLDRQGVIRVADLGLARFFHDEKDLLTMKYDEKNVLGTADYVSPEQALNSHSVDVRADIYSLGATFYFLLTGQPPFPGGKAAQKLIWHQVKQPTPIRELRAEVPEGLGAVVAKMLAKKPAERYQTPADVVEALAPWTGQPVPLPSEREMPRLSPAASGSGLIDESDPGPVTPQRAGRSGPVQAMPTPLTSSQSWAARRASTTPQGLNRKVSLAEVATPSSLTGDNMTPSDQARPAPPAPVRPSERVIKVEKPGPKPPPPPHPFLRYRYRNVIRVGIILLAGAIMGGCLRYLMQRGGLGFDSDPDNVTLIVSRNHQPGTYATVLSALQKARPGDRIQINEETWEEALILDGTGQLGRDVLLEGSAPGGKPVVWRAPRELNEARPLLQIAGIPGLQLKGFVFDGQDRIKDLLTFSGPCPGLTLEDVHLKGFQRSAVWLRGCSGNADRPVTLRHVRATPNRSAPSALLFEPPAGEAVRQVRVVECRLEGPYQAAAIVAGPATEIEFKNNRIFNAQDGLLYRKATPAHPLALTLSGNTFCDVEKCALHFETVPPLDGSRVTLTSNLFARVGVLARTDDFRPEPAACRAAWMWTDESTPIVPGRGDYRLFRKTFTVEGPSISQAALNLTADAAFTVWINGERVGHGDFHYLTRRVFFFDVTRYLRPGLNNLAIQGLNRTGASGVLAQLTYSAAGSAPVTVISDATWKTAPAGIVGWQQPGFDDSAWKAVKIIAPYGKGATTWQNLVWDSALLDRFQGKALSLFPEPTGNVRDWTSMEEFPPFKAVSVNFDLPTNEKDDAHFLRYPKDSPLTHAGSPGAP
jgi:eukaryotic-like serine/threonine-protein kinase